jgi:hypothetical protein
MTATPPAPPRGQRPKARPPRRRTSQLRQTIFAPWRAHKSVCSAGPVEASHHSGGSDRWRPATIQAEVRSLGKGRHCVRLHTGLAAQEGEGIVIGTGESGGNAATGRRRGRSAVKDVIYFNGQRYRPAFLRTNEPYARQSHRPRRTSPGNRRGHPAPVPQRIPSRPRSLSLSSRGQHRRGKPRDRYRRVAPGGHLCPSGRSRPARAGGVALGAVDDN